MSHTILYVILGILVFDFIFEKVLSVLNANHFSPVLPNALKAFYDAEKYKKSQLYFKDNLKFSFLTSTISFLVMMAMIFFDGFAVADQWVRQVTDNPIWMALLFFGGLGWISDVLSTPFSLYDTFVIEQKYGFNKTTVKTFFLDQIKGWLLGAVIGGGVLALIVFIYQQSGDWFWLLAWVVMTLFSALMMMFYTSWILPLFNKLIPLEEGSLRQKIEAFSGKVGFALDNIYIMDGSKRSSKANAFFSGLGAKKTIVLYDTLVNEHTEEELVAVLAHEIGHYKKKHTLMGFIMATIQSGLMLFILSFFIDKEAAWPQHLAGALGAQQPSFHLGILAFGLLYSPLSTLIGIVSSVISRKNEYEADRFAAENYDAKPLMDALKKMSVKHLSNMQPHPAYVFVHYSHPPLLQRLEAMEKVGE